MNGQMDELDEKEREKRKNDKIDYRQRQNKSNTFLFVGTICEIILSATFFFIYFILSVLIVQHLFGGTSEDTQSLAFNIFLIISFVGCLVSGFFVYRKLGRLVIKKWKLENTLREDVLNQFKTHKEFKADYEKKHSR